MAEALRLGTRGSALALAQSGHVAEAVSARLGRPVELVRVQTEGDVNSAAIAQIGGTGVFVTALRDDTHLDAIAGWADDSGEGRWTIEAAIHHAVPLPVITAALYARFASRQQDSPAMKVVAALRNQFGGHAITAAAGEVEKGADAPGADVEPPVG